MLAWLSENWANVVVIAGLALFTGAIVFRMIRNRKAGKRACGCNCAACGACECCKARSASTRDTAKSASDRAR